MHVKNQNRKLFIQDQYCHLVVKAPQLSSLWRRYFPTNEKVVLFVKILLPSAIIKIGQEAVHTGPVTPPGADGSTLSSRHLDPFFCQLLYVERGFNHFILRLSCPTDPFLDLL